MQVIFYNNSTTEKYSPTFPIAERSTLDESLDTASFTVENITKKEPFGPLAFCSLRGTMWVVASDDVVWVPTLKRWTHNVSLVEPTKWLERFMVGTKTVTQPITRIYDVANSGGALTSDFEYVGGAFYFNSFSYRALYSAEEDLYFPSVIGAIKTVASKYTIDAGSMSVFREGELLYSTKNINHDFTLKNPMTGVYTVRCSASGMNLLTNNVCVTGIAYQFSVVDTTQAEPITLLDVAEDLLAIVEPLRAGEKPRFSLSESAKDKLRGITSPEFTFTNNTLREALDEIGKVIGCISRLHIKKDGDTFVYEIDYDPFCTFKQADLAPLGTLRAQSFHQDAEQYCTALDSTVDNLMEYNGAGTVADPGPFSFRTVRTEDTSYQITEAGAVIYTQYPIEVLEKLEIGLNLSGTGVTVKDATKYCFESAEYATLSSYSPAFPYSKAYALRYAFGQKNITSLAFEMESAVSQIFKQPSLVNVINEIFDTSYSDFGVGEEKHLDYNNVLFRVTYRPSVSARVITRKSLSDTPSALAFNQGAAKLDSTAFGRNAYGNALRMGNAEEERRYVVKNSVPTTDLPKCGEMVGNDTFISSVERKYFANYSEVILSLSKNFNRLSAYVGIDHSKRIYEISEKLGVDRYINLEDVCIVRFDDDVDADSTGAFAGGGMVGFVFCSLMRPLWDPTKNEPMSTVLRNFFVYAQGEDEKGNKLSPFLLPVASYGMGTSLVFSWRYTDNYSAGTFVNEYQVDEVKSYAQSDARYTDLYGRIDKMGFKILANRYNVTDSQSNPYSTRLEEGRLLPLVDDLSTQTSSANYITVADCTSNPVIIKKDNREALNMTYQVSFVGQDGIFVMPGLAEAMNAAEPKTAKVWVLDHPITPLSTSIDLPDRVGGAVEFSYDTATLHSLVQFNVPFVSGAAFVIATDDGEVLLGANRNVTAGELIKIRFDIINPRMA